VTTPRRRILRPEPAILPPAIPPRIQKVRDTLGRERDLLNLWMTRLKRAFNALQKHQNHVAHLERRIRRMENP
jgi:hypothetical protein